MQTGGLADGRPAAVLEAAMPRRAPWLASMAPMAVEVAGIVRAGIASAQDPAHSARAARRAVPPCGRSSSRGQAARGHRVGLIVNSTTGGPRADAALAELAPHLALGLASAWPSAASSARPTFVALRRYRGGSRQAAPDVLHGHGAKGAALARLTLSAPHAIRVYTPHGGSLVYRPGTHGRRVLSHAGMGC